MKATLLLTLSLFLSIQIASAQYTFQSSYGDALWNLGFSANQTSDNGYMIAGVAYSSLGDQECYMVKADSVGDFVWSRFYGGLGSDAVRSVSETSTGNYFLVGTTSTYGAGGYDFLAFLLDVNGDTVWTRTYGTGADEIGYSGEQTTDGGYIMAGDQGDEVYVVKIKSDGDTLWTRSLLLGGFTYAQKIHQTTDNGYVIIGYTNAAGSGANDFMLIKLNANGNVAWAKTYGGTANDQAYGGQQTTDGGYVMAGLSGSFGDESVYVVKTDQNGVTEWSRTYGGGNADDGYDIQQTADGGYAIAGTTFSFGIGGDAYLIKTDNLGVTDWSHDYGGTDYEYAYAVHQTSDKGYLVGGYTMSFGYGGYDLYLAKTDSVGHTGCFEFDSPTITDTAATAETSAIVNAYTGGTVGYAPFTITDLGGGITQCLFTGVAHTAATKNAFVISPNPSDGNFLITFDDGNKNNLHLEVVNVLGEVVLQKTFSAVEEKINLQNQPAGIYFVRVSDGELLQTQKIIVR